MWFSENQPHLPANFPDADTYWASNSIRVFDCDTVGLLLQYLKPQTNVT